MLETRKIYTNNYSILLDRKDRVIWACGDIHKILEDGYKIHSDLLAVTINPNHKYDGFTVYCREHVPNLDRTIKTVPWREML